MKNNLIYFFILLLPFSASINAQDIGKTNKDGIITDARFFDFYQQNQLMLLDLQGDYTLSISYYETINNLMAALKIKKPKELEKLPREIEQFFFNMYPAQPNLNTNNFDLYDPELDQEEIESLELNEKDKTLSQRLIGEKLFIEGKKKPFRVKKIMNMFKQVMFEEYQINNIRPALGEFHEFHPLFKEKYNNILPFALRFFNKIFLSLAKGVTSKFLFTGQEKKLLEWILKQAVNSISIEAMFRKSYQINHGNLYLTLLTIENILSYNWKSTNVDRESREVTLRLRRITHYIGQGDKFGHWYHFFGIMLYGLYKGRTTAQFVAEIESLGSFVLSRFVNEKQENMINRFGAIIGAKLRKASQGDFFANWESKPEYLLERYYLNDQTNENYQRQLKKAIKQRNSK